MIDEEAAQLFLMFELLAAYSCNRECQGSRTLGQLDTLTVPLKYHLDVTSM